MDLPDGLTLPLDSGASWWYWLGGRPAFDLVNTLRERWWRNVETLVGTDDLLGWLARADLLDGPAPATDAQLRSVRRLREAIDAGIVATTRGAPVPETTIAEINRWLVRSPACRELVGGDGTTVLRARPPGDPVEHAIHLIAEDAAEVFAAPGASRARICASETCSARFFDASRAGTRRWCSMSGCGNAAKARRHRARSAQED